MANSSIYEKIENKGALDAKAIREAGEEKAQKQMQEAIDTAKLDIENLNSNNLNRNNEKIKTKITQFEQLAKQRTLHAKKDLIDEVFLRSLSQLQKLDGADLSKFVIGLLKKDTLSGDEVIKVNKDDFKKYLKVFSTGKKIGADYELDLLNKHLHKGCELVLSSESVLINGGFMVIGKTFDINHSFAAILESINEKYETEIAIALFGKGD